MQTHDSQHWQHAHDFHVSSSQGERRTFYVVLLTAGMMVIEIAAGYAYGSIALLADGWHMGTHVAALGISLFAYSYARRNAGNSRYSFGTGKVGALGGFASAIALAVVALLMGLESVERLISPEVIRFNEAIAVAVVGLAVNLASAWLLQGGHDHHEHHHHHGHSDHDHHHHDHNLRAAYLHVLADALTSLLAIIALIAGKWFGWVWMDALMGIVGGIVIARWSFGLIRDTSGVLLDGLPSHALETEIKRAIESDGDNSVTDLHLWRLGPSAIAAIVSIVAHNPRDPSHYKALLADVSDLAHVTVEVNRNASEHRAGAAG